MTVGRLATAALIVAGLTTPGLALETRCGWIANPTPANWWLTDADATWTLSTQGAPMSNGFIDLPDDNFAFGADWVETNGYHGYGCACIAADDDFAIGDVLFIQSMQPLPLSRCEADPALSLAQ